MAYVFVLQKRVSIFNAFDCVVLVNANQCLSTQCKIPKYSFAMSCINAFKNENALNIDIECSGYLNAKLGLDFI